MSLITIVLDALAGWLPLASPSRRKPNKSNVVVFVAWSEAPAASSAWLELWAILRALLETGPLEDAA